MEVELRLSQERRSQKLRMNYNDPKFESRFVGRIGSIGGSLCKVSVIKSIFCKSGDLVAVKGVELEKDKIAKIKNNLNQVLEKSNSQYLIQYFCFFERPNRFFLVMEFCSDGNLESLLVKKEKSRTLFSGNEIERMVAQLTVGLCILHSKINIFHGELNTEKILLSKDNLKIADFATSRLERLERADEWSNPELRKKTCSKELDIYDMGLIFKQIVSVRGMVDFETHTSIPCELKRIIKLMLLKTSDDRPSVLCQSACKPSLMDHPYIRKAILKLPKRNLPVDLIKVLVREDNSK